MVLLAASAFFSSLEAYALQDGQTLRIGRGAFSIMPKNSSLDAGAQAEMWTDAQTNSQRWVLKSAGTDTYMLSNAYTGKFLACTSGMTAGAAVSVQDRAAAASRGRWQLVPVEGSTNQYYIYASSTRRYALSTQGDTADGNTLTLVAVDKAEPSQYTWTVEECAPRENELTPEVRDDMMEKWKAHY